MKRPLFTGAFGASLQYFVRNSGKKYPFSIVTARLKAEEHRNDAAMLPKKIEVLIERGVNFPHPESVFVDDTICLEKISGDDVTIYSGCKLFGKETLVLQGATLGYEGPVTIEDCQVGPGVQLKSGFFKKAVFLKNASMGSGSHVREGTILEEEASAAHTVGLKQTILFPYVTLGSLINFCDCFMSGGTSRKKHSEVGSSFIHFNYTTNQDKATPSLIGDVPKGVMLDQTPIFLGGQGGLVGPTRLAFGTITAAGTICRKDELRPGRLTIEGISSGGSIPFSAGVYTNIPRIINNNVIYIGNLIALMQWYHHVRSAFISPDFPQDLLDGLKSNLTLAIDERIKRLKQFFEQMADAADSRQSRTKEPIASTSHRQMQEPISRWKEMKSALDEQRGLNDDLFPDYLNLRNLFLEKIMKGIDTAGKDYLTVITALKPVDKKLGSRWLQGIVDQVADELMNFMPLIKAARPSA